MVNVVIASAVRTPIGSFNGALAGTSAVELGIHVVREALGRSGLDVSLVDEVILGQVLQAGQGQNVARQVALGSGLSDVVPAQTINKVCGSGLKAVMLAAQAIRAGDARALVAGGTENMSQAPYVLKKARWGLRMGNVPLEDVMLVDALTCAQHRYHMGITAENVVRRYGITRQEQDELALWSQEKAVRALDAGAFDAEIVPVVIPSKKGEVRFDTDEYPRRDASLEALAKLRPAFDRDGTVTAGNASGINDGAAALVVVEEQLAKDLGLPILARIRSYASAGVAPEVMGLGPVPASRKALELAGLTVDDIDLVEANEAFAAQFLAVGRELGFHADRVNVNGGAIALGHPVGASGARILVTLLHALKARDKTLGLATLCIGGGQGVAMVVERV